MHSSSLPRTLVLRTAGTNCDLETAFAFERAGAVTQRVHLNRVLENPNLLRDFQILAIPGGFSYGDDIAAGRIFANQLRSRLSDAMRQFVEDKKPIIGICNGFQVLIKTGLLPGNDRSPQTASERGAAGAAEQSCTLAHNDCGRFVDRWVRLFAPPDSRCIWTRKLSLPERSPGDAQIESSAMTSADSSASHDPSGLAPADAGVSAVSTEATAVSTLNRQFELPIAHGEGKFVPADESIRRSLWENHQVAMLYAGPDGAPALPSSADNPNGSIDGIAGICDATGLILGLMPHPERFVDPTQHPAWSTRRMREESRFSRDANGDGLQIFRNAVDYVISL